MPLPHKERIKQGFGKSAKNYEQHARLQAEIAAKLVELLPPLKKPHCLEIGCGTGLFTRRLLKTYPSGSFLITDLSPDMVNTCQRQLKEDAPKSVRFDVMDGEALLVEEHFDLIVSSMTLQWCTRPGAALEHMRDYLLPGGSLYYATLGPDNFPEWYEALALHHLPPGLNTMPSFPGLLKEERVTIDYGSAVHFFSHLKEIGATVPHAGYRSLSPGKLRASMRTLDVRHAGKITWHIVYGCLTR